MLPVSLVLIILAFDISNAQLTDANQSPGHTVRHMDLEDAILLQNRIRELEKRCKDAENAATKSETAQVKMGIIANDLRVARDQIAKELAAEKQQAAAKAEAARTLLARLEVVRVQLEKDAAIRAQLEWELATERQKTGTNERMREKVDVMWTEYKKRHG